MYRLILTTAVLILASAAAGASDWTWTVAPLDGLDAAQGDHDGLQLLYGARLLNERARVGSALHFDDGAAIEGDAGAYADARFGFHAIRPIGTRFDDEIAADLSTDGAGLARSASQSCGHSDPCSAPADGGRRVLDFDATSALGAEMALLPETFVSFQFRF